MEASKISIIVPVYNAEEHLNCCIDSILNQTYKNFQLILINDGSSDSSGEICNKYSEKDNRVLVIHKDNSGVSSTRNIGIDNAKGKYLMFCDSDDWIEEDLLESLYREIEINKSDIIYSGSYRDIYYKGIKIQNKTNAVSENIKVDLMNFDKYLEYMIETIPGPFLSPWAKLYRLDIVKENKLYFDEKMICFEDFDFNLRYLRKCRSLYFSKNIKYHYRGIRGNEGLTRRKKNNLVYEVSKVHFEVNELLKKMNDNQHLKDYIEYWFIENYKLVFQKIILEEKNMHKNERNDILREIYNDIEFCKFLEYNKDRIRLYKIVKSLVDKKIYNLSYYILRKRLS